jgi:adenylate cyclase
VNHFDRAIEGDGADSGAITLADAPALRLGVLTIEPAARRVVHEDGREQILEPRVMQVLVALTRADGGIVSRDGLFAACWPGVVVGEDALTRVMARLRRLADGLGAGVFKLETITKVGYRLTPLGRVRVGPAREAARERSICVLPFANMSDDPSQSYFSDGISEDIITDLSKVSKLFVIARTTAFGFRGDAVDLVQLCRDLGVSHVLEGSVRNADGRVRITAQLIDGATGGHVWAERYDRDLKDIFALQDEISEAIVRALKLQLLPREKAAIERRETTDPKAYDLYLMARHYYASGRDGDDRARQAIVRLCQRATELDPGYASAWALMGVTQTMLLSHLSESDDDGLAALERALVLDETQVGARAFRAGHLGNQGRHAEALAEIERALSLDPMSWEANTQAGRLHYEQRRFGEAIRYWEKAVSLPECAKGDPGMLMSCYAAIDDKEGVLRAARETLARAELALAQDHINGNAIGCSISALAALGQPERARDLLSRVLLLDPGNLMMRYNFACGASTHLQDKDLALDLIEPVFAGMGPGMLRHTQIDPDLDSLRGDRRYQVMAAAAKARLDAA